MLSLLRHQARKKSFFLCPTCFPCKHSASPKSFCFFLYLCFTILQLIKLVSKVLSSYCESNRWQKFKHLSLWWPMWDNGYSCVGPITIKITIWQMILASSHNFEWIYHYFIRKCPIASNGFSFENQFNRYLSLIYSILFTVQIESNLALILHNLYSMEQTYVSSLACGNEILNSITSSGNAKNCQQNVAFCSSNHCQWTFIKCWTWERVSYRSSNLFGIGCLPKTILGHWKRNFISIPSTQYERAAVPKIQMYSVNW